MPQTPFEVSAAFRKRIASLEAENRELLRWMTENLTVEQVYAATTHVLQARAALQGGSSEQAK